MLCRRIGWEAQWRGGTVRIGISGWTYAPWRGVFYPKGLPQKRELEYAASQFSSLEINGTFYGMQRPDAFADLGRSGAGRFRVRGEGRRASSRTCGGCATLATPLANFIASGLLRLGPKLGPILWQFPPNFRFDAERIEAFLKLLPHDTDAAATLGTAQHDNRLKAPAWLKVDAARQHAARVRDPQRDFRTRAFIDLLRKYDVALVCADTVEWPRLMDLTSDFVYCRLHGSEELYASGYDGEALDTWATRVASWAKGGEPADAERVDGPAAQAQTRRVRLLRQRYEGARPVRCQGSAANASTSCLRLLDRARRLRELAQHELLDLPGRGLRQLAEHEALRHLEVRHVLAAERAQLVLGHAGTRLQFDERAGRLAPLLVRLRHHRGTQHRGMADTARPPPRSTRCSRRPR